MKDSTFIYIVIVLFFAIVGIIIYRMLHPEKREISNRVKDLEDDRRFKQVHRRGKDNDWRKLKINNKSFENMMITIEEELFNAGLRNVSVFTFFIVWLAVALGIPFLLSILFEINLILLFVIMAACLAGPILYIRGKKSKRKQRLEEQLVDAIGIMISSLKAGFSFQSSMQTIAREMTEPIAEEFARVFQETQAGVNIDDALMQLSDRIKSEDLTMLCTSIAIQRSVGGSMTDVLQTISNTIKVRIKLKKTIKAKTAGGRISGYIVSALPFFLFISISLMNKSYVEPLFTTNTGKVMLAIALCLELVGYISIRKITDIKY